MTSRSAWRDPSSRQVAIALAITLALANGIWLLLDNTVPAWDQAHYLSVALDYQRSFEAGGPIEFLHAVKDVDPTHGPLFTVGLTPIVWIFGATNQNGLILNLCAAPFLYFCAGEMAWIMFRKWQARLLTMFLVASMPMLVGLFHNVLQDFLLVTLTTVSLLLLWKSEGFQRRGYAIGMAATMAVGTLTKITFPLFVVGPLAVVAIRVLLGMIYGVERFGGFRIDRRKLAINVGLATVVFLVIAFLWYGPNFAATLEYIRSTTSGPLSEGAGPKDPVNVRAITLFTLGVIDSNLSWIIVLLGVIAAVLDWSRLRALFSGKDRAEPLWKLSFLVSWAALPYLSVALAHNQDVRLMAPAFPAVGILVAGAVSYIRWPRVRYAVAGTAVVLLTYVTITHVVDITPGFFPERATIRSGEFAAYQQLDSNPIGLYDQLPGDDYTTPILEYIEDLAAKRPGGLEVPRQICDLQSEATTNANTLNFLSAARGDPFTVVQVEIGEGGMQAMKEYMTMSCPFAIYIRQPKIRVSGADSRLAIVNAPVAASHMTPQIFSIFDGPRRTFPLSTATDSGGEPSYLSSAGGAAATVLSQNAAPVPEG